MRVGFERTGTRRYAVVVERDQRGDLRLDPAPGWSDLVPHDLVHLVCEAELGLRDGIFGQVAAGGNAHTFVPTEEQRTRAWARRTERRNRATGRDMGASEARVAEVYPRWLRRHGHQPHPGAVAVDPPETEIAPGTLERVMARLDELSDQWRALRVGQTLWVDWPWPERDARQR